MKSHNAAVLVAPALIAAACLGLGACHFPGSGGQPKAPTGEVVATVGGTELTVRNLRAELAGANITDPSQMKRAEQVALQRMVGRAILAKAARDQGLDKTPDFAMQKQRAEDDLLARALEAKIASSVPATTREEAQAFVTAHPDIYSERKIYTVDQIRMAPPNDPRLVEALKPLNSLDDIAALLQKNNIKFQRGAATLDAAAADPRLIEQIVKLPPHEVFVLPSNGLLLVNQIKDSHVEPLTGDAAIAQAMNVLKRQQTQQAVQRGLDAILTKGKASVSINKAYLPPRPGVAAPTPGGPAAS